MKRTFIILFIALSFFLSQTLRASHFMGGEITWECVNSGPDAGKYIFYLKVIRECGGLSFGNSQNILSNSPADTIPLTLMSDYPIDISPVCNSAYSQNTITCAGAESSGQDNTGAMSEYLYISAPILLNGIPPTTAWVFSWEDCCRNPSTNIVGQQAWYLRAKMYPYNNMNVGSCFDNSPHFSTTAKTVLNAGYPFTYSNSAYDKDLDSLSFEWGQALVTSANPVSYASGYSYNNPLPDTSSNINNIAATIDAHTGLVSLLSHTTGAFLTNVKVSSYRDNQLIAEVWREVQLVILVGGSNTPPNVNVSYNTFTDSVTAGETYSFNVSAQDIQFLPGGVPQTMTIKANGQQFGSYISDSIPYLATLDSSSGCPQVPCATLTPAPNDSIPVTGVFGIQTVFKWETSCSHLKSKPDGTLMPKTYFFNFDVQDDYCPAPGVNSFTYSLTVIPANDSAVSTINTEIKSVNELQNGDINVKWTPVVDTTNLFVSYNLYQSPSINGVYNLVDSITNPNISSYTINSSSNSTNKYYKIRTYYSVCSNSQNYNTSETFQKIILNVSSINNCINKLTWNNTGSNNPYFIIKKKENNIWSVIDSTTNLNYIDTTFLPIIDYMVETQSIALIDSTGNTSFTKSTSNIKQKEKGSISIGADTTICNNESLLINMNNDFNTYQWYNGITNNWILINGADFTIGEHSIWLKANMAYGCEMTDSLVLTIDDCSSSLEAISENLSFDIFPNPSSGKFTLDIKSIDINNLLIEVISIDGKVIYSQKAQIDNKETSINMDISANAAGSYILRISNNKYQVQKAIKLIK